MSIILLASFLVINMYRDNEWFDIHDEFNNLVVDTNAPQPSGIPLSEYRKKLWENFRQHHMHDTVFVNGIKYYDIEDVIQKIEDMELNGEDLKTLLMYMRDTVPEKWIKHCQQNDNSKHYTITMSEKEITFNNNESNITHNFFIKNDKSIVEKNVQLVLDFKNKAVIQHRWRHAKQEQFT